MRLSAARTPLVAVREAFEFNDAPDAGMEYVQVRVWVRNIGAGADAMHIGESWVRDNRQ